MSTRNLPLDALAVGRIALGVAALVAPEALARTFAITPTAEKSYLTRVYAGRAIAMGLGYLTGTPAERARWHRLGLGVDVSDTVAGAVLGGSAEVPLRARLGMVALTGGYAVVGLQQALRTPGQGENATFARW